MNILFFEHVPFLLSFFEKSIEANGHKMYSFQEPDNSKHILEDISPDLIIYSYDSYYEHWEEFLSNIETKGFKIYLLCSRIPGGLPSYVKILKKPVSIGDITAVFQAD